MNRAARRRAAKMPRGAALLADAIAKLQAKAAAGDAELQAMFDRIGPIDPEAIKSDGARLDQVIREFAELAKASPSGARH